MRRAHGYQERFRPAEGSENRWHVDSEVRDEVYTTVVTGRSVYCSCTGHEVCRQNECRHIRLIRLITGLAGCAPGEKTEIGEICGTGCPDCKKCDCHEESSRDTTRKGRVRRYECNVCKRSFPAGQEFGPTWRSPETIMASLSMYWSGMSTRQVSDYRRSLRKTEEEKYPSPATVSACVRRRTGAVAGHIARFAPGAPDAWSADEMYMLVRKAMRCLYALAGHMSRRVLGAGMAETRRAPNTTPLAREAKKAAGKMPEVMPRDGTANLSKAVKTAHGEKGNGKEKSTLQVLAHIKGNPTNRRHEGPSRSFGKRLRVPGFIWGGGNQLVAGFVAFYNCIRRHRGLGGETPTTATGTIIKGPNPWATLIKSAYWHACA